MVLGCDQQTDTHTDTLTGNEPDDHEAADEPFTGVAEHGQDRELTLGVHGLTDGLHEARQVHEHRHTAADHQVDRDEALHWTVVQMYRSCTTRFNKAD